MAVFLHYWFWLTVVSGFCFVLERIAPWREQRVLRPQWGQDLFWLVFNGHVLGIGMAQLTGWLILQLNDRLGSFGITAPDAVHAMRDWPLWAQFVVFLVIKDFVEWCIHNLLHRVPWLWEFHKVHHSITTMDWIGNMRFHWMEVVVYKTLSYLPLVVLGADSRVILAVAVFGTLIGHLNHANLKISWGPLRYLLNSPRMHIWHHDVILRGGHGQNFGIVLSVWDWLFGTAYMPDDRQPGNLGFEGLDGFPRGLLGRLLYPVSRLFVR